MTSEALRRYANDDEMNGYYLVDEGDIELFNQIEDILRELPPSEKDLDCRRLWISIPRGPIEDFGDYEDYKDDMSYDDFVDLWKYRHPDENDWYVVQCERVPNGCRYIAIDNLVIFSDETDNRFRRRSEYHTDLLKWLVTTVREQVDSVKAGTYHDKVVNGLPIGYRKGVVRRSDVWKSGYWTREDDMDGTTENDIERFSELVESGIEEKPKTRIPTMTVNSYLRLCSLCFTIRGEDVSGMSLKDQYKRFSDGRDGGMLDIDPDDPEAFKEFEPFDGHAWEIRAGHGWSRMHLYPVHDEDGWYLALRGSFDRTDFIHIALEFHDRGLPLEVYGAKDVLRALKGEDYIGIVPRGDWPFYAQDRFSEHDVIECITFKDELYEKLKDKIEWYDVNTFYPVED